MTAVFTKFLELPREIRLIIWKAALPPPRIVELQQRNLKITLGESRWGGCPEIPTRRDFIDYYMEYENGRPRLCKVLGFEDLSELQGIIFLHLPKEERRIARHETNLNAWIPFLPMPGLRSALPSLQIQSIMLSCRESHVVASRFYKRAFGTHAGLPETYFDFQRDTLYLRSDTFQDNDYTNREEMLGPLLSVADTSLAKVEMLAIFSDLDGSPWSGRWESPTELLLSVLQYFPNLKDFTFVVDHYRTAAEGIRFDEGSVFIDPINVYDTFERYRESSPGQYFWEHVAMPKEPEMDYDWAEVNFVELKAQSVRSVREGGVGWKIPSIHYKVALSPEHMDELESERKLYAEAVVRNNEEYAIHMKELEDTLPT
jgi:hypothetical protein